VVSSARGGVAALAVAVALALAVVIAGCHDGEDPALPIDLITSGSGWTATNLDALADAGQCWDLGFGMQYSASSSTDPQRAVVKFDEFECLFSAGALTTSSFDSEVTLCPDLFMPGASRDYASLFGVLTHELGHVAGILPDAAADDHVSIMGNYAAQSPEFRIGQSIFSATDRAMFAEYNPDFVPHGICDPIITSNDEELSCACP
jgi:hypothetical protein